ncbi:MAG: type II secretion system protein [Phycisphaerae bacterium]
MDRNPRPRQIAGFTLVELLVVVGIIAVLVAILLPVLGNAMARAKGVSCMSNMRQVLTAHMMYVGDNDGYMAAMYPQYASMTFKGTTRTNARVPWFSAIHVGKYLNEQNICSTGFPPDQQSPSSSIVYCPVRAAERRDGRNQLVHPLDIGMGYNNLNGGPAGKRIVRFDDTSKLITLADVTASSNAGGFVRDLTFALDRYYFGQSGNPAAGTASGRGYPAYRHTSEANVGFLDGHVESFYGTDPTSPDDGLAAAWKAGKVTHRAIK